jgi:hypothetical protein
MEGVKEHDSRDQERENRSSSNRAPFSEHATPRTCLLTVSQSGVALSLPAALQNAPRLAHAYGHFGLRRQSASVDGAFTSFRYPLPADLSPQREPKRRGAFASRRTPKHPWLAHARGGFGLRRQIPRGSRRRFHLLPRTQCAAGWLAILQRVRLVPATWHPSFEKTLAVSLNSTRPTLQLRAAFACQATFCSCGKKCGET